MSFNDTANYNSMNVCISLPIIFYKGFKKKKLRNESVRFNSRSSQLGKYAETHKESPWRRTVNRSSKQKASLPVPHPTVKSLFVLVYATALLTLKPRWAATHVNSVRAPVPTLEITI